MGEELTPRTLTTAPANREQHYFENHRKSNQKYSRNKMYLEEFVTVLHVHRALSVAWRD
jgi:hypothetical protein